MRVPLYVKVMASYLLVVGLVVIPTLVYLKIGLQGELRGVIRSQLEDQLKILCARLERLPPESMQAEANALIERLPQRVTVLAANGDVLADTVLHETYPNPTPDQLENHATRPEIIEARESGSGMRTSTSNGEALLYAAMRFPQEGPVRGFVRLSVKTADIDEAGVKVLAFLNQSGAAALSAATILSFIAALVVSRPLRRLADAAHAFAIGDFGHKIDVTSNDELGAVGQALGELAAQLRGRLVEAGADRTTLRGLLDELPVGVILFGASGEPFAMNGSARAVCGLTAADENDRARQIAELPEQAAAIERVKRTRITEDGPLSLPWRAGTTLEARWVATAASNGASQVALVLLDGTEGEALRARLRTALSICGARLREVTAAGPGTALGGACAKAADEAERLLGDATPRAHEVEVVRIGLLCTEARDAVLAAAGADAPEIALEIGDGAVQVADAGGVCASALRRLLAAAAAEVGTGARLRLRQHVQPTKIRLTLRVPREGWRPEPCDAALRALGGEDGVASDGGATEAWVALPRA